MMTLTHMFLQKKAARTMKGRTVYFYTQGRCHGDHLFSFAANFVRLDSMSESINSLYYDLLYR